MKTTIKTGIAAILLVAIFFPAFVHAQQQPKQENAAAQFLPKAFGTSAYTHTKLTYEIIDAPNHTYGYDVLSDDRLIIHQKSIPAMPGNEGFKTKADASKVAQLVIDKIKKGEMPPTVTIEEMQKLKVTK
jgi:hypothetical protein